MEVFIKMFEGYEYSPVFLYNNYFIWTDFENLLLRYLNHSSYA